jgi:diguanylate cyclase (GGDEF)-like protein
MLAWNIPTGVVHLTFLLGALAMVPLCRRWIGGPLSSYVVAAGGLGTMIFVEVRRELFAATTPHQDDQIVMVYEFLQAGAYIVVLVGFLLWVRHIRISKTELGRQAATDVLTHLASRRQAMLMLQHEMARARRYTSPLAVVMVDLDRLKPVNDMLGHLAGDAVLVHVAQILKARLRATDVAARYGGDEFLLVLPETGAAGAVKTAGEICRALGQQPVSFGSATLPLQASFGVAEMAEGEEVSTEDLIARADKAVYAVKRSGGNGVAAWSAAGIQPAAVPAASAPQA